MNSNNNNFEKNREITHSHLIHVLFSSVFLLIWTLDTWVFSISTGLNALFPHIIRLVLFIGILCSAFILIRISAKALFKEKNPSNTLMTGGILGYIRHPMYFGILLIYLAFLFLSTSLLCMGFFIIVLITYNKMANYEEKVLEKLFGEEYLEYKQNVSKWFPNPF